MDLSEHTFAPQRLGPLLELEAGLERSSERTRLHDMLESCDLLVVEVALQPDVDLEPPRRRLVVVLERSAGAAYYAIR